MRQVLLAAFLLLAIGAAADRVVRTDGTVVEGTIVRETGVEVTIEVRGFEVRIPRSQVARIERTRPATAADPFLVEARRALDANDPAAAWAALLQARDADADAVMQDALLADRVASAMANAARAHVDGGRSANAARLYEALLRPEAADLLELASGLRREDLERTARDVRGRVLAEEARALAARAPGSLEVSTKLREALALLNPQEPAWSDAALLLAQNLLRRARDLQAAGDRGGAAELFDECLETLESIRRNPRASVSTLTQAQTLLTQLRGEGIDHTRNRLATPTPAPTPSAVAPRTTAEPPPAPQASPLPSPTPAAGLMGRLGTLLAPPPAPVTTPGAASPEAEWGARIGTITGYVVRLGAVGFVLYLAWWLPAAGVLRLMERRGNIMAAQRRGQGRYLGPMAVLLALLDTRAAKGPAGSEKAKKPCPHCRGELGNPDLYTTPNFETCPHCGKSVTPVFDAAEFIKYQAEVLRLDAERVDRGVISINEFVKNSRMERVITALLTDSVRRRASDVHIEPAEGALKIRRRIDGMMTDMVSLPRSLANSLVSAIKVRADLDVSEKRRPQDGSMSMGIDGQMIDMRVASSPSANGEKVSLRLLDIRSIQVNPRRLGMTEGQREIFEKVIALPHGLILVCGPTGSGKTTTLYVALQRIREFEKNIISIEDPIEFRLPGINQIQVNPAAGLTFASGLRSILRQDPDVIMIGEIRDKETAEISVEAATTGHLVLSTTHTIDSATAMARMMEFGISPRRIADSLALIMAQRLIRLVCPDCRIMRRPTGDELANLDMGSVDWDKLEFAVPAGCPTCNRTGYFGRTGLFEMLLATDRVRQALQSSNVASEEIRQIAIRAGMMTMRQQGIELLRRGLTTFDEVQRVTR